jgi:tRNA-binding EMAP/Myf-like protein
MTERKLATIAKIEEIRPHPDADALELAKIRGWQVVVKIGEFQPGDLCVYCEIDSVMPERPEFEFLRPRKFRIKTTKLRGKVSQGIAFSLSILPKEYFRVEKNDEGFFLLGGKVMEIGMDVTEILGVTKYEEPIPASLGGVAKGKFPSHSIKTDEFRVQNLSNEEYKKYHDWYLWVATEKLDGCLDENTIIETEEGNKTIKDICESNYSGKVKTFNLEKQKEEFRKILGHSIKELTTHQWFEIELENGEKVKITGNHKVWIPALLCWRRVDELEGNEEFLLKK